MALRRRKEGSEGEKWLEVDASMTGTLTFKDPVNLLINGRFEGTLDTQGNLAIGKQANVKATIQGETITISGAVQGNVTATRRIELLETARVVGKIRSPRFSMKEGAVFEGTLEMAGAEGANSWMTIEELARYLEMEADTVTQWAEEGRLPGSREGSSWRFERGKIEEWVAQAKIK